jgi:hypothetical protein
MTLLELLEKQARMVGQISLGKQVEECQEAVKDVA